MKKLLPLFLLTLLLPVAAAASQLGFLPDNYFKPLDIAHPEPVAGALIDARSLGNSSAVMLVPIWTHSTLDGCLLNALGICEDWSPLAVGFSMNAGQVTFDAGPLANVLPWAQAAALAVMPASWAGLRAFLTPEPGQAAVTFSAGPIWEYRQATNKGYYKTFTGLALHF